MNPSTECCKVISSVSLLNLQEVTLTFGEEKTSLKNTFKSLVITFQTELLQVFQDEHKTTSLFVTAMTNPGFWTTLREGRLAIGGLLGEIKKKKWGPAFYQLVFTVLNDSYRLFIFKFKVYNNVRKEGFDCRQNSQINHTIKKFITK